MRLSKAWIGSLLVGAALGFAPADARAEDAHATPNGDGGACMADPGVAIGNANVIQEIVQKLEAEPVPESNGDVVQLNMDGYRYGSDQGTPIARELQILDIEVRRARAAAKREGRL